jgi:glycosyltransferase involved in cell wall biosynthesis
MKKFNYLILVIFVFFNLNANNKNYDCLIVGFLNPYDGIGQVSLSFVNCLNDSLKIKFANIGQRNNNIPESARKLIKNSIDSKKKYLQKIDSKVAIFTDLLWGKKTKVIPNRIIKLAYSMTEYDTIPLEWVKNLNKYFDAVIVPDEYLIEIYKKSGVEIPVFFLPMAIDFSNFFKEPIKNKKNSPFIFGCSAGFWSRKNHELLIQAFYEEFGDDPKFQLVIHGRGGQNYQNVEKKLKELNASNIKLINKVISQQEYIDFLKSLDCYVLISKGEGFSITPREALSLGIPCILTNNTAHKTICSSNLVYAIDSKIYEPAYSETVSEFIGHNFNCNINDVKKALRNVYKDYDKHLKLSKIGRIWVKKYTPEILKPKYLTLVKPKHVIYGTKNIISDSYLMTNSKALYNKYKKAFN